MGDQDFLASSQGKKDANHICRNLFLFFGIGLPFLTALLILSEDCQRYKYYFIDQCQSGPVGTYFVEESIKC